MIFLREPFLNQADDILTSSSDYRSTFISCSIICEEEEYLLFFLLSFLSLLVLLGFILPFTKTEF